MSRRWWFLIIVTIILVIFFVIYLVVFLLPAQREFDTADQSLEATDQVLKSICTAVVSEASNEGVIIVPPESVKYCQEVLAQS